MYEKWKGCEAFAWGAPLLNEEGLVEIYVSDLRYFWSSDRLHNSFFQPLVGQIRTTSLQPWKDLISREVMLHTANNLIFDSI